MPVQLIMDACDELAARRDQIYRSLNAVPVRRHGAHVRRSAWRAFWAEVWRPIRAAV